MTTTYSRRFLLGMALLVLGSGAIVEASHAVPKVYHDLTIEVSGLRFGLTETERIELGLHGSKVVPGTQIEMYFCDYVGAIPAGLGTIAVIGALMVGTALLLFWRWKGCRKSKAVG